MYKYINNKLQNLEKNNLLRNLHNFSKSVGKYLFYNNKQYLNFSTNDYLNLSGEQKVINALKLGADRYGVGSKSSQLVTGRSEIHNTFETEFAKFMGFDKALLFSSGFAANIGIISSLMNRGGVVFADKLNHASIVDGVILSRAKIQRYAHLDVQDLEKKLLLNKNNENKLVITESIFSMEGDIANIRAISSIAKEHEALVMMDDAHGIGVLGEAGKGALEYFGLSAKDVDILVCPLGKAFGSMGAIVLTNNTIYKYLLQHARSLMYSTGVSPAIVSASMESLNIIKSSNSKRLYLFELIEYFKLKAKIHNLPIKETNFPIQSLILNDSKKALDVSSLLEKKGIWVTAIRPPTVPIGTSRLRMTITTAHSKQDIDFLLKSIRETLDEDN